MPERYRGHDPRDRFKGSPAAPSIKSTENGFSRCARSINYRAMRPGGEGEAEGGRRAPGWRRRVRIFCRRETTGTVLGAGTSRSCRVQVSTDGILTGDVARGPSPLTLPHSSFLSLSPSLILLPRKRVESASHILENCWGHLTSWRNTFPRIGGTWPGSRATL